MVPRLSNYETNFATAQQRGNVSRISANTPAAIVMFLEHKYLPQKKLLAKELMDDHIQMEDEER